ncbi:MAG: 5'-deoxyadenosine deaminase [Firmicutes bacterium]|nr:5'-deoxyadenosine deaminase [Bacillota bacterium]
MSTVLIKDGTIITMNPEREILQGNIFLADRRIIEIGGPQRPPDKVIDAGGRLVIPGFVQTHIHLCQTLFRGQADDLELLDWLKKRIWPLEAAHDEESLYISALLGIGELFKGGTTTILDMETVHHTEQAFRAIRDTGIRALAGKVMMDYGEDVPEGLRETTEDSLKESLALLERWHGQDEGRIGYAFAPRFAVSCSEDLLLRVRDLARENGVMVHTHASENRGEIELVRQDRGYRNVVYFDRLGLTGKNLILAHCIWLDEEEMSILQRSGTRVVHCPSSNLKLASGIARVPEMLERGISVSLGADGAPCNNNLDMFVEMRHTALIHKIAGGPMAMPARQVFEMATIGGARAIGLETEIGSLDAGKRADLAIVDLGDFHVWPTEEVDLISHLVYAAKSHDIRTVLVDGRVVMEERRLTTIDETAVRNKANEAIRRLVKRAGVN